MRPHIPALIRHLSNHGRYTGIFESYYVDLTHEFYTEESTERAEALRSNAQDFLQHCTKRRLEEQQRAKDVLPESSCASVMDTTDKALLTGRLDWLAKDGEFHERRGRRLLNSLGKLSGLSSTLGTIGVWTRCIGCSLGSAVSKCSARLSNYTSM